MRPLVSVIVPVYNSENYIHRAVSSLLGQSYSNIEIILVDDGSSDNSGTICDEFAAKDARVRCFHKSNEGVSSARNIGLDIASGQYLCFVDSDDYVDPSYIETFINGLGDRVDLVFQGINEIKPGGEVVRKIPEAGYYPFGEVLNGISDINRYAMFGYVCNKLYKTAIIRKHNLKFRLDISLSEDRIFALQYLQYVESMQVVAASSYNYELLDSGLTLRQRSYGEIKSAADENLKAALRLLERRKSDRFLDDTKRMYIMTSYGALRPLFKEDGTARNIRDEYISYLRSYDAWQTSYKPSARPHKVIQAICRVRPYILSYWLMSLYWNRKK